MATEKHSAPTEAQSDVPAVIAGSVNLMAFAGALAQAGIVGRYDADRGVLVIEPAEVSSVIPKDAELGMAWYNRLTKAERLHWHRVAASAVPADAWTCYKADREVTP